PLSGPRRPAVERGGVRPVRGHRGRGDAPGPEPRPVRRAPVHRADGPVPLDRGGRGLRLHPPRALDRAPRPRADGGRHAGAGARAAPRPRRRVRRRRAGRRHHHPRPEGAAPLLRAPGRGVRARAPRGFFAMTMSNPLALHTWTLDTTPLAQVLSTIRPIGWDAVELRRVDWERAAAGGQTSEALIDLVKGSGLAVACVGVEMGWIWARGDERARLLRGFDEQCGRGAALACP